MTFSSMHRVAVLFLLGLSLLFVGLQSASAKPGQACGRLNTFTWGVCGVGEFCNLTPPACLNYFATGSCVRVQTRRCPGTGRAVCGCNRVTYPNDCTRIQAGVSKDHDGHC